MDILDTIFESGKSTLTSLVNGIVNSAMILNLINRKLERYGSIQRIEKSEYGYDVCFQLAGDGRDITVHIDEIRMNARKDACSLHGLSSNVVWLQHIFEDFIEGGEFKLPDNEIVKIVLGIL